MKIWTSKGHLSELALELRAAGEAAVQDLQAMDSHIQGCPACRGRDAEWQGLFCTLASLQPLEPSPSFDSRVMERVRLPAETAASPAQLRWLARWLRPAVVGAAAVWTVVVIGGGAWLHRQVDVPAAMLVGRFFNNTRDLLIAAVLKIGAILHVSGLADLWAEVVETVPGQGVVGALCLMAVLSGLAIWILYRVTGDQHSGVNAHA